MIGLGEDQEYAAEVPFTLPLAADPLTGLTGWTFTLGEVKIRLPDGGSFINVAVVKIREVGFGMFAARLTPAQTLAAGSVLVNAEVADTQPYRGSEIIGMQGGEFAVASSGYLLFYLPQASDPVYGSPITGSFAAKPGAVVKLAWPDAAFVDADVDDVVEFGNGLYGIPYDAADSALRGKVYVYATCDGAQRWLSWYSILDAQAFAEEPAEEPTEPVASPFTPVDPQYVDMVEVALSLLAEQYKEKVSAA